MASNVIKLGTALRTNEGKELLHILKENSLDLKTICEKNLSALSERTTSVTSFAKTLVELDLLVFTNYYKMIKAGTDKDKLQRIYNHIIKYEDCEKLIWVWERENRHIIAMLITYVRNISSGLNGHQMEETNNLDHNLTQENAQLLQYISPIAQNEMPRLSGPQPISGIPVPKSEIPGKFQSLTNQAKTVYSDHKMNIYSEEPSSKYESVELTNEGKINKARVLPATEHGKQLLQFLKEDSLDTWSVFGSNFSNLINKTVDIHGFIKRLLTANVPNLEEKKQIKGNLTEEEKLEAIYTVVITHGDWEKVIYAWEESNNHLIRMLLEYVHKCRLESRALLHRDAERIATANPLLKRKYTKVTKIVFPVFILFAVVVPAMLGLTSLASSIPQDISTDKQDLLTNKSTSPEPFQDELSINGTAIAKQAMSPNKSTKVLEVQSSNDLKNLKDVNTLIISKLVFDSPPLEPRILQNSVINLTITGRVSHEWLEDLIRTFKDLTHISIDMTEVCLGITLDNPETYEPLTCAKCESFQVLNSKTCDFESWIYRWKFPSLKHLTLNNVHINRRNCGLVNRLLNENGGNYVVADFIRCNVLDCTLLTKGTKGIYDFRIERNHTD